MFRLLTRRLTSQTVVCLKCRLGQPHTCTNVLDVGAGVAVGQRGVPLFFANMQLWHPKRYRVCQCVRVAALPWSQLSWAPPPPIAQTDGAGWLGKTGLTTNHTACLALSPVPIQPCTNTTSARLHRNAAGIAASVCGFAPPQVAVADRRISSSSSRLHSITSDGTCLAA